MTTRFIWRALVAVPALHLVAGDYLLHEPGGVEPWTVQRVLDVSPGAVREAVHRGTVEQLNGPPLSARPLLNLVR